MEIKKIGKVDFKFLDSICLIIHFGIKNNLIYYFIDSVFKESQWLIKDDLILFLSKNKLDGVDFFSDYVINYIIQFERNYKLNNLLLES